MRRSHPCQDQERTFWLDGQPVRRPRGGNTDSRDAVSKEEAGGGWQAAHLGLVTGKGVCVVSEVSKESFGASTQGTGTNG